MEGRCGAVRMRHDLHLEDTISILRVGQSRPIRDEKVIHLAVLQADMHTPEVTREHWVVSKLSHRPLVSAVPALPASRLNAAAALVHWASVRPLDGAWKVEVKEHTSNATAPNLCMWWFPDDSEKRAPRYVTAHAAGSASPQRQPGC